MTEKEERIISIEQAIKTGKRIKQREAWELMCRATKKGEELCMIWKIPNNSYEKWYNILVENCKNRGVPVPTTLDEETTYLVYSGEKAFDGSKGGYSIFAQSLGSMKRGGELELDRIEQYECEWAIVYGKGN